MENIKVKISYYDESKISKCQKCGNPIDKTDSYMTMSMPPMYETVCANCGKIGYENCSSFNSDGIVSKYVELKELKELLENV